MAGFLFQARPERLPLGWQGMCTPTSVCMHVRVQWVCVYVSVHTRVQVQTCVHVHRTRACVPECAETRGPDAGCVIAVHAADSALSWRGS